jgi:predicted  nucleic acid-binding Zn-ribbon protein
MDEKDKDWLIEQAEKVEQLQQEIEEWKLENQSLSGSVEIIERKRQELVKQLAIANERIERYEEFIRKIAWWDTFPANPFKAEAEQLLKETK